MSFVHIRLPPRMRSGTQRIYLVQVNNHYGKNIFFPYSVGLLWAYARTFPEIAERYELGGILYRKEPIDEAVSRLDHPDVIAVSCYIWNWRWSQAFCRAVRQAWPSCKIVVGGAQVPPTVEFLTNHGYIDYAIYGEGEGAFADFLRMLPDERIGPEAVGSLIYRNSHETQMTARRDFVELERLRSPYLDGIFDQIFDSSWKWQALQETHRGCPYQCTFCEWGEASMNKVRPITDERVLEEYEWFATHGVEMLYNCDANYGILKRDIAITEALIDTKRRHGAPVQFRAAFAKNSNDKIFQIATMLHEAGMLKSVTLAMQSMDDNVLGLIKRKNIKIDNFASLMDKYALAEMPTYTELIVGLPGETLDTYLDGIDLLLETGQHDGLAVYPCILLPNTEMNTPEHIKEHHIESRSVQAMLLHATPEPDVIIETQELVVGTRTMPYQQWLYAYTYSWLIQAFHTLGLTQQSAIELHTTGIPYRAFYTALYSWLEHNPQTVAGSELASFSHLLTGALAGGSWNCIDKRFGEITWPPEEFAFLRIACRLEQFYAELAPFYVSLHGIGPSILERQKSALVGPAVGSEEAWARDVVWYGRKGYGAKKRRAS